MVMPRSLLLLHEVHGCSAFVHFANAVETARIKENPLGRRRFTRIDVGHDPDIADIFQLVCFRSVYCHFSSLLPLVVGKGSVSFGHAVCIIFLLNGCPLDF